MTAATDKVYINGTQVHPARSAFTYGTCNVTHLDWGTPEAELFMVPVPLADGMAFRGRVTKDRKFTIKLAIEGLDEAGKGQDVWGEILRLWDAQDGVVAVRYVRDDGVGTDVDRTLLATLMTEPAWAWSVGGSDADGLRLNGNLFITLECVAPFPWFRDTDYQEDSITVTDAASNNKSVDRNGDFGCGLEVKISTTGTLIGMTLTDGNRSLGLYGTFSATPKGIDRYYTDPTAVAIDTGFTTSIPASLTLHTDPTVITAVPTHAATGTHTVRIRWYRLWRTP